MHYDRIVVNSSYSMLRTYWNNSTIRLFGGTKLSLLLIDTSFTIEDAPKYGTMLKAIEKAARTCYKSEDKITDDSAEGLIQRCIDVEHDSVLEHSYISVRIICDRGISHELVRHRLCSFSQESQRYVAYADKPVEVVKPYWYEDAPEDTRKLWLGAMHESLRVYNSLIASKIARQGARSVLPNSMKTELVMTANIREWRHVMRLRCSDAAHPDMRKLMRPRCTEFGNMFPVFSSDIVDTFQ